jgi:hypothetical protein
LAGQSDIIYGEGGCRDIIAVRTLSYSYSTAHLVRSKDVMKTTPQLLINHISKHIHCDTGFSTIG